MTEGTLPGIELPPEFRFVFVDTSEFIRLHFGFDRPQLRAFSEACTRNRVKLLVPGVIHDELRRHVVERARDGLTKLEQAARSILPISYISSLEAHTRGVPTRAQVELEAQAALHRYMAELRFQCIAASEANMDEVLGWYDRVEPPFEAKKGKRHEFPDAIALSSLLEFATREQVNVAVVADDRGFKAACERSSCLWFFGRIEAVTQHLLAVDAQFERFREVVEREEAALRERVVDLIREADFSWDYAAEGVDIDSVGEVKLREFECYVIGFGGDEFTAEIYALADCAAQISYDEDEALRIEPEIRRLVFERVSETVPGNVSVGGSFRAKLLGDGLAVRVRPTHGRQFLARKAAGMHARHFHEGGGRWRSERACNNARASWNSWPSIGRAG